MLRSMLLVCIVVLSVFAQGNLDKLALSDEEKKYLLNKKELTVGFTQNEPHLMKDATGKYIGVVPDLYDKIGTLLGVKINYQTNKWNKTISSLKSSQIDIIPIMTTKIAKKNNIITSNKIFDILFHVLQNKNNKFKVNSIEDLKNKKIAYNKNIKALHNLLQKYEGLELIPAKNNKEAIYLLKDGKVDSVIAPMFANYILKKGLLNEIKPVHTLRDIKFALVAAIRGDEPILRSIINKSINHIGIENLTQIIEKWIGQPQTPKDTTVLTQNEKDYLKTHNTFTICSQYARYPLSGYEDGKITGIAGEIYNKLSDKLNITFKALNTNSHKDLDQKVNSGQCDLVSIIATKQKRWKNILPTRPFLSEYYVVVGNLNSMYINSQSDLSGHRFLIRHKAQKKLLKKAYPNINIQVISSIDNAMKKVLDNNKYHYVDFQLKAEELVQVYGFDKYKISGRFDKSLIGVSLGVHNDNKTLLNIIQKTLNEIGQNEIDKIIERYEIKEFKIEKSYNKYLFIGFGLIVVFALLLIYRSSLINREKEKFELLLKNATDGIHILDHNGYVINCSDSFADNLGYTKEEALQLNVRDWDAIIQQESLIDIINAIINTDEAKIFETQHKKKDGTVIDVQISAKGFELAGKRYAYCSQRDISELKQKDNTILEQAKNAALGEMIGNIAHQWRQPLSIISTASTGVLLYKDMGTLNDDLLDKEMNLINDNAQYLSKTIDDFKNFIKGERTKVKFNLSDNIESFLHLVEGAIKNNNILIKKEVQNNIVINSYPNELIQCFINICNNSKDVLKDIEGDRYLFISTSIHQNEVHISFKDNGGGIPQDVLPHIFEPYFTTKHASKGTGLGLHMTYNLITDGMKGSILASNETYDYQGKTYKGAKFTIILPIE